MENIILHVSMHSSLLKLIEAIHMELTNVSLLYPITSLLGGTHLHVCNTDYNLISLFYHCILPAVMSWSQDVNSHECSGKNLL